MTLLEWIGAGFLDFFASLLAFIVWTHLDLEGYWEQRRIEKGRKLDRPLHSTSALKTPPSPTPGQEKIGRRPLP